MRIRKTNPLLSAWSILCVWVFAWTGIVRAETQIEYWIWDATQYPAYKHAADAFHAQNPDIRVKVVQIAWSSYWISLTTSLISEAAPDVFANHQARFPELLRNHTLADLSSRAERDGLGPDDYVGSLFQAWVKDGGLYGIPKDWDTIAIAYNPAMLAAAGVDPDELENLTWNPRDGGTFGRMIARLTLDEEGRNALSPEFDPKRVRQYGLLMDGIMDGYGQVQWSAFALSNGFRYNAGRWATEFFYDDPRLAETLAWLRGEQDKRCIVPASNARQMGASGLFVAERGALAMVGSWMVNWIQTSCDFRPGFAPLPIGPKGRISMFNGLGDSMWVGTKHPEEAWRWIRFLGSREGQMIVADHGAVFPAIREAAERATEVMGARGSDVSVFLRQAVAPGGTYPYPTTDFGSDIVEITKVWMDRIFLEHQDVAESLRRMNAEVNARFLEDW